MSDIDIVTRLRMPWEGMGEMANDERAEAADEIERLRGMLDVQNEQVQHYVAERDEARRRLCVELLEVEGLPLSWKGARGARGIAQRLGWDCFKEAP